MAYLQGSSKQPPPFMRIGPFGGIDLSVTPSQINQNHSPDMLNFNIDERGSLNKRTGYERVYSTSLGEGPINGMYEFRKKDGTSLFLLAHGTKLYTQSGESQPVQIYDGLANQEITFFTVQDKCYLMDGVNFLVFDGVEVKEIEPYIPTITVSGSFSGGGTKLEDFNLLGAGFKESFSGDGANNFVQLSLKGLDNTPAKAIVGTKEMEEGSGFTLDRITGRVTFDSAPGGGTNNITITAYKTFGTEFINYFNGDGTKKEFTLSRSELDSNPVVASLDGGVTFNKVENVDFTVDRKKGKIVFTTAPIIGENNVAIKAYQALGNFKERIKKCRFHAMYGGSNDTRVFIGGNPDHPNQIWRSGLYDPTYWPENGFYKIGADHDKVQGFSKQYDYLVIHKEHTLWNMQYELVNGDPSFPIKPINDQAGTLSRGSIQIIENNPVSLSRKGLFTLVSSNVRDERNIQYISDRVDDKLLQEPNLHEAISIDHDKKYWLVVNGNVYVFDYVIQEWYLYDNIHASCLLEKDGVLHFGSSTDGLVYRFKEKSHIQAYEDDGEPINAYWVSKMFDFDLPEFLKVIQGVFLNMKPHTHTSVDVYYRTDHKGESFALSARMDTLDFFALDFNRFSFVTSDIPQEVAKKLKLKKVNYLQLKLVNNKADEGLGITSLSIKYGLLNEVK